MEEKRVLLAETNKKQQIIAKMALGGTGVNLDIVTDLEAGMTALKDNHYDTLCVDPDMIDLAQYAYEKECGTCMGHLSCFFEGLAHAIGPLVVGCLVFFLNVSACAGSQVSGCCFQFTFFKTGWVPPF